MRFEHTIGGRSLSAECAAEHEAKMPAVFGVFEGLADAGTHLTHGVGVRFGWSLLYLTDEGGHLHVNEPAFARWPEQAWNPAIDTTLGVLEQQAHLLHLTGADGHDAYFDQKIVLAPDAIDDLDIFLRRDTALSDDDSGWAVARLRDPESLSGGEDLRALWIAHLVDRRPSLLQALTLPTGFIVTMQSDAVHTVYDAAGTVRELR
jgi:hypothetical protein